MSLDSFLSVIFYGPNDEFRVCYDGDIVIKHLLVENMDVHVCGGVKSPREQLSKNDWVVL